MVSSFLFRHFTERSDRTFRITLVTSFTGLLILAWANRFVQDDAFISFRYAHNLAHGQGLVWKLIVGFKIVDSDSSSAVMTNTPDAFGFLKIVGANPYKVAHLLKILEVKLDSRHRFFLAYLNRSSTVDEVIKKNGWREYDFHPMKSEMVKQPDFPAYRVGTRIEFASPEADKFLFYGWASSAPPIAGPTVLARRSLSIWSGPCPANWKLTYNHLDSQVHPKQRVTISLKRNHACHLVVKRAGNKNPFNRVACWHSAPGQRFEL